MSRRTSLRLLAAAGLGTALAGCGRPAAGPAPETAALRVLRGTAPPGPAADPRPFGAADTAFGLDVLRTWSAQYPGRNLVFSPATLASSLGLAYLGARGATAAALARVLHLPALGDAPLTAGLHARSAGLAALGGPGVTVSASQRVWTGPAAPPSGRYLRAAATGYAAGISQAPLVSSPGRAAAEINAAIAADTRGHITRLVTPGMLAGVGWVLTSALSLDARWAAPFAGTRTAPGPFTRADGATSTVPYLNGAGFRVARAAGWTAVALPYRGAKLSMTALLPPPGASLPTAAQLAALTTALASPAARRAPVALPRVSLSVTGPAGAMKPALTALGLGIAFGGQADFSGLSALAGRLAFVQQAATLEVGEEGTAGSAAAGSGVSLSSVAAGVPVRFDRPYLMLVSAPATGEPLFLAAVADPAAR